MLGKKTLGLITEIKGIMKEIGRYNIWGETQMKTSKDLTPREFIDWILYTDSGDLIEELREIKKNEQKDYRIIKKK